MGLRPMVACRPADSPLKCTYADVPVMKPSRLAEDTLHAPWCAPCLWETFNAW